MSEDAKHHLLRMLEDSDALQHAGDPIGIQLLRELVRTHESGHPIPQDLLSRLVEMAKNGIQTHNEAKDTNRGNKIASSMQLTRRTSGNKSRSSMALTTEEYETETMPSHGVIRLIHETETPIDEAINTVANGLKIDRRTVVSNLKRYGKNVEHMYLTIRSFEEKSSLPPSKLDQFDDRNLKNS